MKVTVTALSVLTHADPKRARSATVSLLLRDGENGRVRAEWDMPAGLDAEEEDVVRERVIRRMAVWARRVGRVVELVEAGGEGA